LSQDKKTRTMPMSKEVRAIYNLHQRNMRKAEKQYVEVVRARKVGTTEWTHTYDSATHASQDEEIGMSSSTIGRIINGKRKPKTWEFKREVIPNEFKYDLTWDDIRKQHGIVNKSEIVRTSLRIEHEFIDGVECKCCWKCKQKLPLDCFYPSSILWDRLKHRCKECIEDKFKPNIEEYKEETKEEKQEVPIRIRSKKQERLYQSWLKKKEEYIKKYDVWLQQKDHSVEIFVPVKNYPGYVVSNWGNGISYRMSYGGRPLEKTDKRVPNRSNSGSYKVFRLVDTLFTETEKDPDARPIYELVAQHFLSDYRRDKQVDHKDRDKANNHISNLRITTKGQNQLNKGVYRNNKTGHRGVCYEKKSGRYRWYVSIDDDQVACERADTKQEAIEMRIRWIRDNILPEEQEYIVN
jgi:predicted  nucleic acid-binding Zn-ribbon protein